MRRLEFGKSIRKYLALVIATVMPLLVFEAAFASCRDCPRIQSLTSFYEKLDYKRPKDFDLGAQRIQEVRGLLQAYAIAKSDDSAAQELWLAELTELVGVALPYDVESSVAEVLQGQISRESKGKTVFERSIGKIKHTCDRQLLVSAVEEFACLERLRERGAYESGMGSSPTACIKKPVFNYDDCLNPPSRVRTSR